MNKYQGDLFSQPPPVSKTPTPAEAIALRDEAMELVERNAGKEFQESARKFIVEYLEEHGETSGEVVTDACKAAGIIPDNNDRAFGPAYLFLARRKQIEKCGTCSRNKGHGAPGATIWRIYKGDPKP